MTPAEAAAAVSALAQEIPRALEGAAAAELDRARQAAEGTLASTGLATSLEAQGRAPMRLELVSPSELQAVGLAALVEEGGQTAPHAIEPRDAQVLALATGSFAPSVDHPGSRLRPTPALAQAAEAMDSTLSDTADQALEAAIRAAGLA